MPAATPWVGRFWTLQAASGILLIGFLGSTCSPSTSSRPAACVTSVRGGIPAAPLAVLSELGLVASVLVHVVLGLRAVAVDFVRDTRTLRRLTLSFATLAIIAFVYAVWHTVRLVTWS